MEGQSGSGSHGDPPRETPVSELAARAHVEAAKLAELHGHVDSARDHRAFALRVRAALRKFDTPPGGRA